MTSRRWIITKSTQVQSELDLPGFTKIENSLKQPRIAYPQSTTTTPPIKFPSTPFPLKNCLNLLIDSKPIGSYCLEISILFCQKIPDRNSLIKLALFLVLKEKILSKT